MLGLKLLVNYIRICSFKWKMHAQYDLPHVTIVVSIVSKFSMAKPSLARMNNEYHLFQHFLQFFGNVHLVNLVILTQDHVHIFLSST
jgi:hypothetical protein